MKIALVGATGNVGTRHTYVAFYIIDVKPQRMLRSICFAVAMRLHGVCESAV